MHDVDRNGRTHGNQRVLHARIPAVEAEEHDACRHGPDAGVEVGARHLAAVHRPERQLADGVLQRNDQHSHRGGNHQGAGQHVGAFAEIACAEGLRRKAARTHPHEGAVPVDEVENRHPDGQRTDVGGRVTRRMAGDGRTDDAHQGHRDVRDDVGQRQAQDFAVHRHGQSTINRNTK